MSERRHRYGHDCAHVHGSSASATDRILGIGVAQTVGMTPLASLPMFEALDGRHCHIHVFPNGCVVDLSADGQSAVTLPKRSLKEAYEDAEMLRRLYAVEEAHIFLGDLDRAA